MRKTFLVRSSDRLGHYSVAAEKDGATLRAKCDCKAGSLGKLCTHNE